jgi:hypothetical protein
MAAQASLTSCTHVAHTWRYGSPPTSCGSAHAAPAPAPTPRPGPPGPAVSAASDMASRTTDTAVMGAACMHAGPAFRSSCTCGPRTLRCGTPRSVKPGHQFMLAQQEAPHRAPLGAIQATERPKGAALS